MESGFKVEKKDRAGRRKKKKQKEKRKIARWRGIQGATRWRHPRKGDVCQITFCSQRLNSLWFDHTSLTSRLTECTFET